MSRASVQKRKRARKRSEKSFCLLVFMAGALLFSALPAGRSVASPWLEAAEKEGEIVLYTSFSQADLNKVAEAFSERYPKMQLKAARHGSSSLLPKITAEIAAGRQIADLVMTKGDILLFLQRKGVLQRYDSPERKAYPKNLKDNEGYWTDVYPGVLTLGYNTGLVPKERIPGQYTDLLNSYFKGKLGINLNNYMWAAAMLDLYGHEKGMGFLKKLAAQNPKPFRGNTQTTQFLAAGEIAVAATLNSHDVDRVKRSGGPVDWARLAEPLYADLHPIAIMAQAPHPNAARLFVDFILSREAQTLIAQIGRVPARGDVPVAADIEREKLRLPSEEDQLNAKKYRTLMIDLFSK